jgi:hypothetical protein
MKQPNAGPSGQSRSGVGEVMQKHAIISAAFGVALAIQPLAPALAAIYGGPTIQPSRANLAQVIQGIPETRGHPAHPGPGPRGVYPGARAHPEWRGQPGWRGAPAWHGPHGYAGRPYWYGRPWVRRPYYGTVFAGVALGTLVTVAAIGAVPPRPHPNLCWYWADQYGQRGYWDYC